MGDGARSCLGVFSLFAAIVFSVLTFLGGWIGWEFRVGLTLGLGSLLFFLALALYMFITIQDYSWLTVTIPAVLAGAYTIMPDVILGPADDLAALILGAVLSAALVWYREKGKKLEVGE